MAEKEISCTDCFVVLNKIETTLSLLRGDLVKIIISMLGMIAAQIGVKYLGTPWYLYIMVYVSIVVSIFLVATTVLSWNKIPKLWACLAFLLAGMFVFASLCRVWAYSLNESLSPYAGIIMQLLYAAVGVMVIVIFWRNGRWNGNERRKTCEDCRWSLSN